MDAPTARSATNSVLAVILGGGAGTRLYPLTKQRAKPAVPIGGAYRLIDVPMSNCINSGINKIYVLTQVGGEEGKVFFWGGRRRAKISRPDFCPDPLPPLSSVQLHLPQPPPGPNLQRGLRRPLRRRRLRGGRKIVFSFLLFFFLLFFFSFFLPFFSCRPRAHNRTHAPPHPTPAQVLAATQTPTDKEWFQGTADAVRQYAWLFSDVKNRSVEDVVILSGDHLCVREGGGECGGCLCFRFPRPPPPLSPPLAPQLPHGLHEVCGAPSRHQRGHHHCLPAGGQGAGVRLWVRVLGFG